ncbi:MAG TPA: hypothetical protein VLM05_16400, partial [Mycobacteriales bacterium]|nr:hypothetical protein [Mycobacteriales bacterium]
VSPRRCRRRNPRRFIRARLTTDRAHATIAVWAVVAGEAAVVATVAHGSLTEVVGAALGTALVAAVLGLAWTARSNRAGATR